MFQIQVCNQNPGWHPLPFRVTFCISRDSHNSINTFTSTITKTKQIQKTHKALMFSFASQVKALLSQLSHLETTEISYGCFPSTLKVQCPSSIWDWNPKLLKCSGEAAPENLSLYKKALDMWETKISSLLFLPPQSLPYSKAVLLPPVHVIVYQHQITTQRQWHNILLQETHRRPQSQLKIQQCHQWTLWSLYYFSWNFRKLSM